VCKYNPLSHIKCDVICDQTKNVEGVQARLGESRVEFSSAEMNVTFSVKVSADGSGGIDVVKGNEAGIELEAELIVKPTTLEYSWITFDIAATRVADQNGVEKYQFDEKREDEDGIERESTISIVTYNMPMEVLIRLKGQADGSINGIFALGGGKVQTDGSVTWTSKYSFNDTKGMDVKIGGLNEQGASERFTETIVDIVKKGLAYNEKNLLDQIHSTLTISRIIAETTAAQTVEVVNMVVEKAEKEGKAAIQSLGDRVFTGVAVGCSKAAIVTANEMYRMCTWQGR